MGLGLTLSGHGGISPAIAGFCDHEFFFLDNGGNIPFAALAPYGVTNCGMTGGCTTGSFAVSTQLQLAANQLLEVTLGFLTIDAPHYDAGQCYLVSQGQQIALLFSVWAGPQSQNVIHIVPVSAGVTLAPPSATFLGNTVPLGGLTYGPQRRDQATGQMIPGGSIPWITASYAPAHSGDYQLLFAMYNTQGNSTNSALTLSSIRSGGHELLHL